MSALQPCNDNFNDPLKLIAAIDGFSQAHVLIIGDVMLDEYLTGDAERISPEAPVPVVRIDEEDRLVGGAGNVARNITALGGNAFLIGVRGNDRAGNALEEALAQDGIAFTLHTTDDRPTTIKTRVLARRQQVLRIDREDASPLAAAHNDRLLALARQHIPTCGAIVVSDYGKGLVTEAFMQSLHSLIAASGRAIPVLVDPKPQNFRLYKNVNLLTPNAKETSESAGMPVGTPEEIIAAGRTIMERLECRHLVTTLGSEGMAVFENRDTVMHIPTTARQVYDVTGAGDTVIASIALGSATGLPLVQSCLIANYAAGIVVGKVGAATASPNQVAESIATLPKPAIARWL